MFPINHVIDTICLLLLCCCFLGTNSEEDIALVEVEHGKLRGKLQHTILSNKTFYAFKGIPYAAPPIGELRFRPPQPLPKWENIRDAFEDGNKCVQIDMTQQILGSKFKGELQGNEDCLFLNVYTPELPLEVQTKLKPVMVWIHGGSYKGGTGDTEIYGPDFLLDDNVVLVTCNYRLGPLGFLSLQNVEAPGNYGLKDQIQALKWVQKNIMKFGGDPNSVTVFGESAGSGSLSVLMLSPLTDGLFHKVILQSGTIFNAWTFNSENLKTNAFKLGELMGFKSEDPQMLLKFLQTASAYEMVNLTNKIYEEPSSYSLPLQFEFGPTIEPKEVGDTAVLTTEPLELLTQGRFKKLPVMLGQTLTEFIIFVEDDLPNTDLLKARIDNLKIELPERNIKIPFNSSLYAYYVNNLKSIYSLNNVENAFPKYLQMKSDLWFSAGINMAAEVLTAVSPQPIYYYRFSYDGGINVMKIMRNITYSGTSHGDELCYLFACKAFMPVYKTLKEESRDLKMIKVWSRLLTNFAKTGNPTPSPDKLLDNVSWLPRTSNNHYFLEMADTLKIHEFSRNYVVNKWRELIKIIRDDQNNLVNH